MKILSEHTTLIMSLLNPVHTVDVRIISNPSLEEMVNLLNANKKLKNLTILPNYPGFAQFITEALFNIFTTNFSVCYEKHKLVPEEYSLIGTSDLLLLSYLEFCLGPFDEVGSFAFQLVLLPIVFSQCFGLPAKPEEDLC